jgi:hypothetical protein
MHIKYSEKLVGFAIAWFDYYLADYACFDSVCNIVAEDPCVIEDLFALQMPVGEMWGVGRKIRQLWKK